MTHEADARVLANLERQYPPAQAFRRFSRSHWADGALSSRDKHLIAVAVAQVTRCGYCIAHHALLARDLGASLAELLAASYVTAALESLGDSEIRVGADLAVTASDARLADGPIARSRHDFVRDVLQDATLPLSLRGVLAAAIAYAKGNGPWQAAFHAFALDSGVVPAALEEAYAVAAVIRTGVVYAHTLGLARIFEPH
ncbi:carboxymuconolactone decarboxylase family protein [Robbsia sp. Bb-Pol-6]|uniref:Carboxymuconolactone decarboxylase family protein n=1 Tax=Robbsia betulipollinis TaxID=2981849 RepID=A0ABT3ZJT2_9BURK|nr:carboxymuconolactone decarboxylase family protein [Robbsia betulipollinis]MCY0386801.1 carboxymuconolactone decarboxylase family protein [Robbsia betulipollinis]